MANTHIFTFKVPTRGVFLNVFEPKSFMHNGKPTGEAKYGALLLIPETSPDLVPMKAVMAEAARSKWATRGMGELAFPLKSGAKMAEKATAKNKDGSFYLGNATLKTSSKFPPILSIIQGGKIITLDSDALKAQWKSKFYSGCQVAASVNFVPYEDPKGLQDGVTAYLQSLLWVGDGERIGQADQSEVFKSYVGQQTNVDPLGDDDIPF
jgi:hypothetical protein